MTTLLLKHVDDSCDWDGDIVPAENICRGKEGAIQRNEREREGPKGFDMLEAGVTKAFILPSSFLTKTRSFQCVLVWYSEADHDNHDHVILQQKERERERDNAKDRKNVVEQLR